MSRFEFEPVPTVAPTGAPGNDYESIPAATPEAFGAVKARAEQTLGQGVENTAEAGLSVLTARKALTDEITASESNTALAKDLTDRFSAFGQLQGKAAHDELPKFKQDIDDLYQKSIAGAGDNLQMRAMLAKSGRYLTDSYYRYATNYADSQWRTWQTKTFDDRATEFGNQAAVAAQHGTWDEVGTFLNTSDDEIRKKLEAQHWAAEDVAPEIAKRRGANVRNIVETLAANGDPRTAQAVFDKYKDGMDAGSVLAVTSRLKNLNAELEGRQITDEETGRAPHGGPPQPTAGVPASFVGAIKREEGFDPKPRWDVKQWTVGYGTRASGPDERPSEAELERRFQSEVGKAAKIVDGVNPNLDPGTRAALTSLTYNTGDAWTRSGLGASVRAGDIAGAQKQFLQYANVAGQPNAAIAERRWREAQWFGQAEAPAGGPTLDRRQAYDRIISRTAENPLVQNAAIARMNQIFSVEHAEQTQGKVLFNQRVNDTVAEARTSGGVANPVTENEFVQQLGLVPGREAFQEYGDALQLGANIRALGAMTPEEVGRTFNDMQPQPGAVGYARAEKNVEQLSRAYDQLLKARSEDAGGTAVRDLPAARAAWETFQDATGGKSHLPPDVAAAHFADTTLAEQARVGVPPEQRRILPKSVAQDLAARWRAAGNAPPGKEGEGGAMAALNEIQATAKLWGDRWPEIYREVAPKLDATLRVVAAGVDPAAGAKLLNAQGTPIGKILASEDEVKDTDLKKDVVDAIKPFARTVAGSQRDQTVSDYTIVTHKLAAIYARDGMTSSAAAAQAAQELVLDKYDFVDSGDSRFRVPKLDENGKPLPYTARDISAGAAAAKQKLGSADLPIASKRDDFGGLSPEYVARETAEGLRRNGIWVTSPREDGLALLQGNGFAARRPDGSPLVLTWKELAALGRGNPRRDNYDLVGVPP